jgi:Predicted membrane protein (DUF2207)
VIATSYDGFHGGALAALVAAVVAAGAWLTWLLVLWFRRVPRLPRPGPETAMLGPEPPAVANLLVNEWYVTSAAVPATLLDLAARRVVGLEEVGSDRFVVRTRAAPDRSGLTAYELQVLRFVEARATGGSAPVDVLRIGTADGASWLGQFSAAVVEDAEARGLAIKGLPRRERIALAVGLAVLLGLAALAFELAHVGPHRTRGGSHQHAGAWFAVALAVWFAIVMFIGRLRVVHATGTGRAACARWLGVRSYLRRNQSFVTQPPAAVAIWGRAFAYGVALGANRAAVAALPVGPDDTDHAWSRATGSWRRLRVRIPRRFGAGEAPRRVLVGGVLRLLVWCAIGLVALPLVVALLSNVVPDALDDGDLAVLAVALLFVAVPTIGAVYVGAHIVDGAVRTWRGVIDVRRVETVEGPVIKTFGGRFIVDDGSTDDVVAFAAPASPPVLVGEHVRVTFTPTLHHVTAIEVVDREEETHGTVQAAPTDVEVEH